EDTMENNFDQVMSLKTTEELIQITQVTQDDYQEEALEAAKKELGRRNISTQEVETMAQNIAETVKRNIEMGSNTVSSGIRFLNFLIDSLVFAFIILVFAYVLNVPLDSHILIRSFIVIVTYILYYLILEMKFQKTLGKMLTKTKVVTINEEVPSSTDIIIRSVVRIFPFDNFTFLLMRNGLHDRLSNTKVVKVNKKTTDDNASSPY
ncbi:MAG: RDD family protein, partial [Dysgonomonas sp.]